MTAPGSPAHIMPDGLFPIFLRIEQLPVLIVGGGRVGCRRARALLEAGARRVSVVSIDFDPDIPENARRVHEAFRPEHLEGQRLVLAATNSAEVNEEVCDAAAAAGVLCARTDDFTEGDFIRPAVRHVGQVIWAVSAGVPALSRQMAQEFEVIASKWAELAGVAAELRRAVRGRGSVSERRKLLGDLGSREAQHVLGRNRHARLARWLSQRHPAFSETIHAAITGQAPPQ